MMHDLEKVCDAMDKLLDWIDCEVSEGKENVACHIDAFGKLVDAAKDMGELEEKLVKARYYHTVTEAMLDYEEDEEESERYGYDNWRYASGRYAPKGHGHRSGYSNPFRGRVNIHEPMMDGTIRMGYPMDRDRDMSKYGRNYDEYIEAKRHYTESRKDTDHKMMNDRIENAVMDTVMMAKEMYKDASPETRKGMKDTFKKMLDELV